MVGYSLIGDRVTIHSGSRVGQRVGFARPGACESASAWPRYYSADAEMGANCAIDRGTLGDTIIGEGSKLDNLVHLAHNVVWAVAVFMAGQSGIAGGTYMGITVRLAGKREFTAI